MQIYISGSLAFDRIMTFPGKFSDHILPDKIHMLNVCFLVDGLEEKFGGTGGNIAYNLALLEQSPLLLSCVGKDFAQYADRLSGLNLPLDGIRTMAEEFTAGAYITTDMSDNQITGFNPGAMKHSCGYLFKGLVPEESVAIISPTNVGDMMEHPKFYRENGVRFIFDPGQQITAFTGEQLASALTGSAILMTNDYELQLIMNATGLNVEQLLERTGALVTTLGEEGSVIRENGGEVRVPAVKVAAALDPTGAGDAYRAGFLKGLVEGRDLATCAKLGSTCASFCVERRGTQEHSFTSENFAERYESTYGPLA